MSISEWVNYGASIFTTISGLAFMSAYHMTARWYTSPIGRMMMAYAASVTGLAMISTVFYAFHVNVEWIRVVRGALLFMVGTVMWYQTIIVVRVQAKSLRKNEEET